MPLFACVGAPRRPKRAGFGSGPPALVSTQAGEKRTIGGLDWADFCPPALKKTLRKGLLGERLKMLLAILSNHQKRRQDDEISRM